MTCSFSPSNRQTSATRQGGVDSRTVDPGGRDVFQFFTSHYSWTKRDSRYEQVDKRPGALGTGSAPPVLARKVETLVEQRGQDRAEFDLEFRRENLDGSASSIRGPDGSNCGGLRAEQHALTRIIHTHSSSEYFVHHSPPGGSSASQGCPSRAHRPHSLASMPGMFYVITLPSNRWRGRTHGGDVVGGRGITARLTAKKWSRCGQLADSRTITRRARVMTSAATLISRVRQVHGEALAQRVAVAVAC